MRKCEICQHDDIETMVHSSSIGAISFNYCYVCSAMGAEPKGFDEISQEYVKFNPEEDKYYLGIKYLPIELKNGKKFKTRKEFVNYLKKSKNLD